MRFFLIDDDPMMVKLQTRILMSGGHEVEAETESDLAMRKIKSSRPECVITDLMMPGLDGYQLITQIKKEASLENTIIIVLSAKGFMQDMRQALDFGATGFIRKPIDPMTYLDQIEEIIESVVPC